MFASSSAGIAVPNTLAAEEIAAVFPLEAVANMAGLRGSQFRDARRDVAAALARELGMTPRQLRQANEAGKSVEELGAARGVPVAVLQAAAEAAMKAALPPPLSVRVPALVRLLLLDHHHPEDWRTALELRSCPSP
jgi:hypothetical protein